MSLGSKRRTLWVLAPLLLLTFSVNAQCKKFAKKACPDQLGEGYMPNGRASSLTLYPGENAVVREIFYPGQKYKIVTCAQEDIAPSQFTVSDTRGNVLFDSSKSDESVWEFEVDQTVELDLKLFIPPLTTHTTPLPGCAGLMVGISFM